MPEISGPNTTRMKLGRGRQSPVEVDRRDERLEAVGDQGELLRASRPRLAGAHPQEPSDAEVSPLPGESRRGNEVRLDLRERPLLQVRKEAENELSDDEAQNRVAQELEPLVVGRTDLAVLVAEGLVRERALEKRPVAELVADPLLKVRECVRDDPAHTALIWLWCRRPDSNRHGPRSPRDFKSRASTNFATPARLGTRNAV